VKDINDATDYIYDEEQKYLYPKGLILNLKLSNEWYNMMMLKINNTRSNKKTFTATEIDLFLSKNNQILLTRMY
jgi:hypothetical protein